MSSNAALRLTLRQKPHLDFVIGYPGLIPDENTRQASLEGTVEVRVQNPVFTKWLKVELKKTETVQTARGIRKYFELIGSQEQILWSGEGKQDVDNDHFAPLDTSDHIFAIPIPPGLPPSITLDKSKNTGVVYHLVATAMVKVKSKGFLGVTNHSFKPPSVVTQISEVNIEKHELNPAWPIYTWQAEVTPLSVKQGNLVMRLKRENVIFGGNDPIKLEVELKSERTAPIKVTRIEMQLKETITTREADSLAKGAASTDPKKVLRTTHDIINVKSPCQNLLYQSESMSHDISAVFPIHHHHYTVQNAKHLEVKYTIRLRAVIEIPKEAKAKKGESKVKEAPIKEIILDDCPVIVSPWSKKQAEWWKTKIGHVPQNLQRPEASASLTSPSASSGAPQNGPPAEAIEREHINGPTLPSPQSYPAAALNNYGISPAAAASKAFTQRIHQSNGISHRHSLGPATSFNSSQARGAPDEGQVQAGMPAKSQHAPPPPPQASEMHITQSDDELRAQALEKGRRLSSWPPPPRNGQPSITIASPDGNSSQAERAVSDQGHEVYNPSDEVSATIGRQTKSEHGHGSYGSGAIHWQPPREVTSLDGHAAALRKASPPKPYRMDGAYPSMPKSASQPFGPSTLGYSSPWSPNNNAQNSHRRVFSDSSSYASRKGSQPPLLNAPSSPIQDRRLSTPILSSSIPINTKRSSMINSDLQQPEVSGPYPQNGYPTRQNTLSTITGSDPSSQQSSPVREVQTVPMPQTEWASAEQEKERLYREATERARRTQETAGNTIAPEEQIQYRSVQDRTPTPLSLMRSFSNPGPSRSNTQDESTPGLLAPENMGHNRYSTASTHLGYLPSTSVSETADSRHNGSDEAHHEHNLGPQYDDSPVQAGIGGSDGYGAWSPPQNAAHSNKEQSERSPHLGGDDYPAVPPPSSSNHHSFHSQEEQLTTNATAHENYRNPLSASTTWSNFNKLDAQKMAYLKALAAREAYQQRMAGGQPEPLTALEEKEKLRQMYEDEELRVAQGDIGAWNSTAQEQGPPEPPPRSAPSQIIQDFGEPRDDMSAAASHATDGNNERYQLQPDLSRQTSVYLTPDTSYGRWQTRNGSQGPSSQHHNPYFESAHSSSSHLPSEDSSLSQSYRRHPAISKGKQRLYSTRIDENNDDIYEDEQQTPSLPPARPPKSRDIIHDSYKHLDTPVSPDASEYERRLLWGRSQGSHYGH